MTGTLEEDNIMLDLLLDPSTPTSLKNRKDMDTELLKWVELRE